MTDKEKAEEIACNILSKDEQCESYNTLVNALMQMAEWKNRELLKEYQRKVKALSNKLLS